jgi:Collagen triple helix repeat (20 copies)
MLSRLRNKVGTAGLIVAVVALVAAVGGSAIAANQATDSAKKRNHKAKTNKKKKQKGLTVAQVRRIAKQEARKFANSNPGAPGLQGPQGLPGSNGSDGSNGANGSDGSDGAPGANGKSVTLVSEDEAASCPNEEGLTYEIEGTGELDDVCDGEDGADGAEGPEGSPWTVGGVLPSGETETGAWTATSGPEDVGVFHARTTISYSIPLAAPLSGASAVAVVKEGETPPTKCDNEIAPAPGPENPEADPGVVCVFIAKGTVNAFKGFIYKAGSAGTSSSAFGSSISGARVDLFGEAEGVEMWGTFAVTAP